MKIKIIFLVCALSGAFSASAEQVHAGRQLFEMHSCSSCHDAKTRSVGPALSEIAGRYKGKKVVTELAGRIRSGSQGRWGDIPHPVYEAMSPQDANLLAQWILARN